MRQWAWFSEPVSYSGAAVEKIMLYQRPAEETCVFLYARRGSQISCADEWYPTLEDALAVWDSVPHSAWIPVDDPLPDCQEDAFDPIRVKGRAEGKPEWGRYEVLVSGVWREYRGEE